MIISSSSFNRGRKRFRIPWWLAGGAQPGFHSTIRDPKGAAYRWVTLYRYKCWGWCGIRNVGPPTPSPGDLPNLPSWSQSATEKLKVIGMPGPRSGTTTAPCLRNAGPFLPGIGLRAVYSHLGWAPPGFLTKHTFPKILLLFDLNHNNLPFTPSSGGSIRCPTKRFIPSSTA